MDLNEVMKKQRLILYDQISLYCYCIKKAYDVLQSFIDNYNSLKFVLFDMQCTNYYDFQYINAILCLSQK